MTPSALTPAPRRSCLSVPASSARKLEKAASRAADEILVDLEDAVAATAKDQARASAVAALQGWRGQGVAVRVNAPRTPWCHRDVMALAALDDLPHSIVVPKVESPGDLAFVERLLDGVEAACGRPRPLRVQALIETAAGLAAVREIAASSARLDALVLGYADLAASLGGSPSLDAWLPAQHAVLLAARANGLQAIDGPFLGVAVDDRFRMAARRARELGFDGKWAIHPSQLQTLDEVFSPTEAEVGWARSVIDALAEAEHRSGAGATLHNGEMLDEAVRVSALGVLARAGAVDQSTRTPI